MIWVSVLLWILGSVFMYWVFDEGLKNSWFGSDSDRYEWESWSIYVRVMIVILWPVFVGWQLIDEVKK